MILNISKCDYYINQTHNALRWRQKQQVLEKLWMNYLNLGLKHCASGANKFLSGSLKKLKICFFSVFLKKLNCASIKSNFGKKHNLKEHYFCKNEYREEYYKCHVCQPSKHFTFESHILTNTRTRPASQECFTYEYLQYKQIKYHLNQNYIMDSSNLDEIHFSFPGIFSLNITFTIFLLSDMCFTMPPYSSSWRTSTLKECFNNTGTEYMFIRKESKLYFCMKRPKFTIYAKKNAILVYSICKVCLNYRSSVVFYYQSMEPNFILTLEDSQNRLHYRDRGLIVNCLLVNIECKRWIYRLHIRVHKYQNILITKITKNNEYFSLNGKFMHNIFKEENYTKYITTFYSRVEKRKVFIYKYFNCHIEFYENRMNTIINHYYNFEGTKSAHLSKAIAISKGSVYIRNVPNQCRLGKLCQEIYQFNMNNSYLNMQIISMKFEGIKSPTCLYGGFSFYEYTWRSMAGYNTRIYKEIETVCNNYLSLRPDHLSTESKYYGNSSNLLTVPYISATDSVTLVIYHDLQSTVSLSLKVTENQCRGVFLNPCIPKHSFPEKYYLHAIYYTTEFTSEKSKCYSIQLGLKYLPTYEYRKHLHLNYHSVFGCQKLFLMPNFNARISRVLLEYTYIMNIFNYIKGPYKEIQEGDSFSFVNNVTSLKQEKGFYCRRSMWNKSKYTRRQALFSPTMNISRYSQSVHHLKSSILVTKGRGVMHDLDQFQASVHPFSKSNSLITFYFNESWAVSRLETQLWQFQLLPSTHACLGDTPSLFLKIARRAFKLSFLGSFNYSNCPIGHLQTKFVFCSKMFRNGVPFCERQKNYGQDVVTWKSKVSTTMIRGSGFQIMVDIPGHVFNAEFIGASNCCFGRNCWLQYTRHYMGSSPGKYELLSRKLEGGYQTIIGRSWFKAQKMCTDEKMHLPSITSQADVDKLIGFIRSNSKKIFITTIFIGIIREVRSRMWTLYPIFGHLDVSVNSKEADLDFILRSIPRF